jgi:hypothetical protein
MEVQNWKKHSANCLWNFRTSFPDKEPVWFSNYQGRFNQKLVYQAKFIFWQRYCQAIYDMNGNKLLLLQQ